MKKIFTTMMFVSSLFAADIYKDTSTSLIWQDNSDTMTKKVNWKEAKEYCKRLSLAGYDNWRLPYIKELQSIIDKKNNPAIKKEFKNVAEGYYWSNSVNGSGKNSAWGIYFKNGTGSNNEIHYKDYVRCVR